MLFGSQDFESMNETDVREEIISQLLRKLGYKRNTVANILTEESLNYPKIQMGRKKPNKDPALRGNADYILEIDNKFRWVIEAKAGYHAVSSDDIQQAFSYANHPEVKAILFVVTNGADFRIFQTNHGPAVEPVLQVVYDDLMVRFNEIQALLSPAAIRFSHSEPSVSNSLKREAFLIESKDPRIKVEKIDIKDGVKRIQLSSKEENSYSIDFNILNEQKAEELKRMIDFGGTFEANEGDFELLSDEPLFDGGMAKINFQTGNVKTGSLLLTNADKSLFWDISGNWYAASKGASFVSNMKKCPLKLEMQLTLNEAISNRTARMGYFFDFSCWDNVNLHLLPYLDQMLELSSGENDFVFTSLIEGVKAGESENISRGSLKNLHEMHDILLTIKKAQELFRARNLAPLFPGIDKISKHEVEDIHYFHALITEGEVRESVKSQEIRVTLNLCAGDKSEFSKSLNNKGNFRLPGGSLEAVILGEKIVIPDLDYYFSNSFFELKAGQESKLDCTDAVEVECTLVSGNDAEKICRTRPKD